MGEAERRAGGWSWAAAGPLLDVKAERAVARAAGALAMLWCAGGERGLAGAVCGCARPGYVVRGGWPRPGRVGATTHGPAARAVLFGRGAWCVSARGLGDAGSLRGGLAWLDAPGPVG